MRTQLLRLSLAAVLAVAAATAQAQTFPSKPFRFIVPFPAGGATDAAARAMQPQLEKIFGQPVVVDNRPGAGAVIGLDAISKSAPDGYTFGIGPAGAMSVNPAMQVKMPFDVRKDLTAISGLAQTPFILAAAKDYPARTLQEVIAKAKAAPGTLTIGHGGNGTSMFFTALLFTTMADVKIGLVPYRGTAPVATDLIGGHIGLGIVDPPPSQEAIRDGRIRGIAISSKVRSPDFPEIPTFDEQGLKGYEVGGWFGLVGPAGIPPDVLAKLNSAMVTTLKDPEVVKRIRDIGMETVPMAPAEFSAFVDKEIDKIAKVLAQAGDVPK